MRVRYEDMTVEGRMAARRLHDKLCELTAEYKGVRVEMCVNCVSRCEYGKELMEAMGMKPGETVRRERLYTDPVLGQGAKVRRAMRLIGRRRKG